MDPLDAQATDEANPTDGVEQESAPSGVQARIDELTGKFRAVERALGEKDQTIAQLTNRVLELSSQSRPAKPDPLEALLSDIDPEDKRRVDAIVASQLGPLMQRLDQLSSQLQETRAHSALAQVEDPEVRKRAQSLIQGWRQKGIYGSVATDEDAILMAEGMLAREGRTRNRAEDERAAFNRSEAPFSSVRAAPAARGPQRRGGIDLSGLDAEALAAKLRENPALEDQLGDFEI